MAMQFRVKHAEELRPLAPGSHVRFDLAVGNKSAAITSIRLQSAPGADFPIPKLRHQVAIGEVVPDFKLPDSTGRPRHLSELFSQAPLVLVFYRGDW